VHRFSGQGEYSGGSGLTDQKPNIRQYWDGTCNGNYFFTQNPVKLTSGQSYALEVSRPSVGGIVRIKRDGSTLASISCGNWMGVTSLGSESATSGSHLLSADGAWWGQSRLDSGGNWVTWNNGGALNIFEDEPHSTTCRIDVQYGTFLGTIIRGAGLC
jgi:hypothetical protein